MVDASAEGARVMTLVAWPRVEPRPERLKRCTLCKDWLPVVECFQRDRHNPDGRRNECRACRSERREQLRWGMPRFRPWQRLRFR